MRIICLFVKFLFPLLWLSCVFWTSAAYRCQANLVIWVAVICNQKEAQRKIGSYKESRGHWVFFLSFFPQHIQKGDVLASMVLLSMCGGLWQLEVQQGQQHKPWSSTGPGASEK